MEKLKAYFSNQLSEKENDAITEQLLTRHFDRELAEQWSQQLAKKYKVPLPKKKQAPKNNKIIRLFRPIGLAAAMTTLLFFTFNYLYPTSNQPPYEQLVIASLDKPYEHTNNRKGVIMEDSRTQAIDAYVAKDYKKAIDSYQLITSSENATIEDHFFLGLSYLYVDQTSNAIPKLKKALAIPTTAKSDFRSKEIIHWYLALAYLKDNKVGLAKEELKKIKGLKKQKALELLRHL